MKINWSRFQVRLDCWLIYPTFNCVRVFILIWTNVLTLWKTDVDFTFFNILSLDKNKIASIPSEIGMMTNLIYLTLSKLIDCIVHFILEYAINQNWYNVSFSFPGENPLQSIPSEIALLTNLKQLWLGEWKILVLNFGRCFKPSLRNGFLKSWLTCIDYESCICFVPKQIDGDLENIPQEILDFCSSKDSSVCEFGKVLRTRKRLQF